MRSTQLLSILATTAAVLPAQWALQSAATAPSARRAGAAAFDPSSGSGRVIIYGGLITSPAQSLNEMWAYSGAGQWTQLNAPGATMRWGHQMVTDTANNRLITFGGRSPSITSLSDDTRAWDGSAWQEIQTANAPSPRFLYGMAYDVVRNRVVVFGGRDGFSPNNETWEFDGTDWTQIPTVNAPAPREEMGMVFDSSLNRVVLFGGCDESSQTVYGDTWSYDGTNWTDVTPSNSPAPRFRGSMVYDTDRSRTVYFGGYDGITTYSELLEYSGGEWTVVPPAGAVPPNTTEAYAAYDQTRGVLVHYGGFGPTFSNETWEFTGNNDGVFSLYGQACDTLSGTPELDGTTPNIGTNLVLTASNLGTATGALWALGFSDQFFNGVPLPFDLAIIGLPGCGLVTGADVVNLSSAANGATSLSVPLPNQGSLIGQSLFSQALPFDGNAFLGATRGGRALIGQ